MSAALEYLYDIYDAMLDLLFNRFYMFTGVSVGWVMITVMIFAIVIRNILNIPNSMAFRRNARLYMNRRDNGRRNN